MQSALPLAGDLPHHRQDIPYILTLYPEWAWAFHLGKDVENRGWEPPDRLLDRWLAIRAGAHVGGRPGFPAALDGMSMVRETAGRAGWSCLFGRAFQGSKKDVELTVVDADATVRHEITRHSLPRRCVTHVARLRSYSMTSNSPWAVVGQVHWQFDRVLALPKPVHVAMGSQGIGIPDPETVRQILRQVKDS